MPNFSHLMEQTRITALIRGKTLHQIAEAIATHYLNPLGIRLDVAGPDYPAPDPFRVQDSAAQVFNRLAMLLDADWALSDAGRLRLLPLHPAQVFARLEPLDLGLEAWQAAQRRRSTW